MSTKCNAGTSTAKITATKNCVSWWSCVVGQKTNSSFFCNIGILRDRRVMESKVFKTFLRPRCSVSLFVSVCISSFSVSLSLFSFFFYFTKSNRACTSNSSKVPNLWQKLSKSLTKNCQSLIFLSPKIYVLANKLKFLDWLHLVG